MYSNWLFAIALSYIASVTHATDGDGSAIAIPSVTLKSGYEMPVLGLGTGRLGEFTENATKEALRLGYRLLDTAKIYDGTPAMTSEEVIGKVMREAGIPREELFIITKIMPVHFSPDYCKEAISESLDHLGTSYVDLVLINEPQCDDIEHFCNATGTLLDGWKSLEALVDEGKIRSIGLSNCYKEELGKVNEIAKHPVSVIQNWFDPYFQDRMLRMECQDMGIVYMGFATLGTGWYEEKEANPILSDDVINKIAKKHGRSPSDVVLKWARDSSVVVIPGSTKPEHLAMNLNSLSLQLGEEDLLEMDKLDGKIEPQWNDDDDDQEANGIEGILEAVLSKLTNALGSREEKPAQSNDEL